MQVIELFGFSISAEKLILEIVSKNQSEWLEVWNETRETEFQAVIIPVVGQHFNMLFRNLIYTGLTRAKKLAIFVGSRTAFAMAVGQIDNRKRQTALTQLITSSSQSGN
jgi:hypothetical protein